MAITVMSERADDQRQDAEDGGSNSGDQSVPMRKS